MSALVARLSIGASLLALAACGGNDPTRLARFSTGWQDDQGRSIGAVRERLRSARPATSDVVVAVAGANADKLIGQPLGGVGSRWTFEHPLDGRPVIGGAVVVGSGGGEVFALDAATGKRLWTRSSGGGSLVGAGDDGATTAVVLSKGDGSRLLFVARDGSVKQSFDTDVKAGDPAVVGGVAFVPWQNQYVSAIDVTSGDEVGRVTLREKVSRALTIGGGLYFGEIAFVRFDDQIAQGSRGGATRVGLPSRELPGTPRLLVPGTEKLPAIANARDRDRLFARPSSPEGPLGIDSSRFYASYFRLVLGFEAERGQLAWVHTHATDVIGGEAVTGGVLLCDEQGKITVLDAQSGQVAHETTFGEPIRSCLVQADTYAAPRAVGTAPALGAQISLAVSNREATLATAQRLLLRELATIEDEAATKTLVDIASDPRAAPVLVADARAALASRKNGAAYMLEALGKRYDFLGDVLLSPPVGPLADALATMKEAKAAPLLAGYLLDPSITDDDVKRAAAALAKLATKSELVALKQFFAMYRGGAETDEVAFAAGSVAEAILRLEPKDGRALVEAAVRDPMTNAVTRSRLEALLAASAKP